MTPPTLTAETHQISVEHGAWTEAEFLRLGETPDRIELFDGSLLVSPSPKPIHQQVSRRIANAVEDAGRRVGLDVYLAVNVRLKTDRIPIPDLVVVTPIDPRELVIDAASVRLACEVTSPSNAANDRYIKMHHYAEAGIPWFLLVDTDPEVVLRLFRLDGEHYLHHGEGRAGHPLRLTDPIAVDLDPAVFDL